MQISQAIADLDDAINAYAKGSYDSQAYRGALAALICDDPCVITRGGYSNQAAANAAAFINHGGGSFIAYCAAWGEKRNPKNPAEAVIFYILDDLVCVNKAGRDLLMRADQHFSALDQARRAA